MIFTIVAMGLGAGAARLRALGTAREHYAAWSHALPQIGGLGPFDLAIEARRRALLAVAERYPEQPRRCWANGRGPRPPLVVKSSLPTVERPRGWAYAVPVACLAIAGGVAYAGTRPAATPPPARRTHAAAVLATPRTPAPAAPAPVETVRVDVDRCRLRAGPTAESAIVGRATRGETCALVDWSGNWADVRCDDTPGFMHRGCLATAP